MSLDLLHAMDKKKKLKKKSLFLLVDMTLISFYVQVLCYVHVNYSVAKPLMFPLT